MESKFASTGDYTFDWVVTFDREKNITINNYTFDELSSPGKMSLILRLDKPIDPLYKK